MPDWDDHALHDVADEVTPRSYELLELAASALARGHDISRPRPGDGRCLKHAIRGCPCGATRPRFDDEE